MIQSIVFLFFVTIAWIFVAGSSYILFFVFYEVEKSFVNMQAAQWMNGLAALLLVTFFFTGLNKEKFRRFFAFRRAKMWQTLAFIVPCVVYTYFLMLNPTSGSHGYRTLTEAGFLFAFLSAVIAAPVIEEAIFRGGMFHDLSTPLWSKIGVLLLSSITFVALHTHFTANTMFSMMPIAFLLGIARLKTNSIIPPMLMHAATNLSILIHILLR